MVHLAGCALLSRPGLLSSNRYANLVEIGGSRSLRTIHQISGRNGRAAMKITHVVDSMEIGGAETLVAQMCRLQREQGHEANIYAIGSLGPLGEQLRCEGFPVRANMARHLSDAIGTFFHAFKSTAPDVVHLHNPTPTAYAAFPARIAGVSSIVSTRHGLVALPYRLSVELKYGVAARFCDWVVGICDATAENLKGLHTIPRRKIVRVYNGAVPISRVPLGNCPSKDGFTLLFVGRLAPVKNLAMMLKAFRSALTIRKDLRLWIVGDGSERGALESLARELDIGSEVTFWGQQLDVAPFFSAADVFVMSSRSEGLPMSLLQAMSVGLPAIVTDIGGMAEAVGISHAGLRVRNDDAMEMADAMVRLAGSDEERATFSRRATECFASTFGLNTMASSYHSLYMRAPDSHRSGGTPSRADH